MTGVGSHELATKVRTANGRTSLRADLAHDYAKAYGRDARYDCLDGLERWARWRQKLPGHERAVVKRTIRQLADAFELPHRGSKDAHQRYATPLKRQLRYLQQMGWVKSFGPQMKPNGEGECIVIVWAPVAQLDQASGYRRRGDCGEGARRPVVGSGEPPGGGSAPARTHFFSGEVFPPSGRNVALQQFEALPVLESPSGSENGGASARVPAKAPSVPRWVHAERARLAVKARVRVSLLVAEFGIEEGARRFAALPWASEVAVVDVARILHQLSLPASVLPLISVKRQAQLEAAARRMDRIGGPGSWIRYAGLVFGGWAAGELGFWLSEPPRSLGALALELRREANRWRHGRLERRRERLRPLEAARHRQAIKLWRPAVRRGDAHWKAPDA